MNGDTNTLDLTRDGVQFAKWRTAVQDDALALRSVGYSDARILTASFTALNRKEDVEFRFPDTWAFRVLDEGALLELWAASSEAPRPAQTTFRVRGHKWQDESFLAWIHGTSEPYFSYMIATDWDCLEVVCHGRPKVRWIEKRVAKAE